MVNFAGRFAWLVNFHRAAGVAVSLSLAGLATIDETEAATLTARGNEPAWHVEISETAITFRELNGENFKIEPVPQATTPSRGITIYSATVDGQPFSLTIEDKICADTMTGMPHPKAAAMVLGTRSLSGCAGEPAFLLHGGWSIEEINGSTIVTESEPSLVFDPDGNINGNTSCNRFLGKFTLTGEGLTISETGASMMMCDQPLMEQERSLLVALQAVRRFEVVAAERVHLLGDDSRTLVSIRRLVASP
ncbi:META domain-containing protein [Mesorhizobium sp. CAU 1732]|uniref:META domain-containing protein n=1 Tax=Mesorhizobium sp. CAU 1732 TaxID=3140358 RepID=UPI003261B6BB